MKSTNNHAPVGQIFCHGSVHMDELKITRCNCGKTNVYLLHNGCQSVIVDTGTAGKTSKILRCLNRNNLKPEDIELIILTHTHNDHTGSLVELQKATGAKVMVGKAEAGNLEKGYTPLPRGSNKFYQLIINIGNRLALGRYEAASADYVIDKDFSLREFGIDGYVIPTPGHTKGSISIILNNQKALVGDALFHIFPNSVIPPFMNDPNDLLDTWEKFAKMELQRFYPGHGSPISREILLKQIPKLKKKTG